MEYKRLTKYNENTHNAEVYAYSIDKDVYFDGMDIVGNENSSLAQETIDRLAELEDKIENGTLIELPCKVGDKVYYVNEYRPTPRIEEYRVYSFTFDFEHEIVLMVENGYGFYKKQIFLTKAEAEAKLRELKFKERVDCGNSAIVED